MAPSSILHEHLNSALRTQQPVVMPLGKRCKDVRGDEDIHDVFALGNIDPELAIATGANHVFYVHRKSIRRYMESLWLISQ
jgi:hypothetical protein